MGAILLDGVHVGKHAMVGAGALVRQNTKIPSGEVWLSNAEQLFPILLLVDSISFCFDKLIHSLVLPRIFFQKYYCYSEYF